MDQRKKRMARRVGCVAIGMSVIAVVARVATAEPKNTTRANLAGVMAPPGFCGTPAGIQNALSGGTTLLAATTPNTASSGRTLTATSSARTLPSASSASFDYFTNFGHYMPRTHCLRAADGTPDWPWILTLIFLTVGVMVGYVAIYRFWCECYFAEQARDRNAKLMQLATIFVVCALTGYGMSIVIFFWPAYRLLALILVALNFITWRFVSNLQPFRVSFEGPRLQRQLNEQLAAENAALELKNHQLQQTRDELQKTVEELGVANRELDEFAHAASHDLKSPLRAICTLSDFVADAIDENDSQTAKDDLAELRNRAQRLERILNSMLQYARLTRQAGPVESVRPSEMVADIAGILDVPEGFAVKHSGDDQPVRLPAAPMHQVVRNLVDNAIKHHDRDQGTIEVRTRTTDQFTVWEIADDGPGVEPEFRQRMFRMFETLRRRDEHDSSGMGLAIVQRIVRNHGGEIEVDDREEPAEGSEGRGTVFRVTWPLRQNEPEADSAEADADVVLPETIGLATSP